jgi:hypothetical protein
MEGGGRGVCHGMLVLREVNEGSVQEDDASVGEGQQNAKLLAEKMVMASFTLILNLWHLFSGDQQYDRYPFFGP